MSTEDAIRIYLDRNRKTYRPLEHLAGEWTTGLVDYMDVRAVELAVVWYTEGKGDEDLAVHHFERWDGDDAPLPDMRYPRRFSVQLPQAPLSYEGVLIKVTWCVRLRVFFQRGKEAVAEATFRLGEIPIARKATRVATVSTS